MQKPQPTTKSALDYHECRDYLQSKYGYDERDYAGKFKQPIAPNYADIPYEDFWQFVIQQADYISNGSYFAMSTEWVDGLPEDDYRSIILNHYFEEFGNGQSEIEFWVEW